MTVPLPLPLEEAQARLLALAAPLAIERLPVTEALGRYLAEPLTARRTQPAAAMSAMDGYAVRAADLPGPWSIVGESAAGHPFGGVVSAGQTVRIATGALVPAGADTVLIQENCVRDGALLALIADAAPAATAPGQHIRRAGNDFSQGQTLLAAGTRLGPAQLGLALTGGHRLLAVHRRPRVTIIDSGDELSIDPEACAVHQIPASNGVMLAALVAGLPAEVTHGPPVPDQLAALVAAFDAAASADVIVTSGGASVGDHDLLRPALAQWGAEVDFWRVAIKPGKPLLVARKGPTLVLGLPGNPVSSMVTAQLFLLPLLRTLLGAAAPLPRPISLVLAGELPAGGDRHEFLRGQAGGSAVRAVSQQDSGAIAALAASNCLIDRPAHAAPLGAGCFVSVYLLENRSIA